MCGTLQSSAKSAAPSHCLIFLPFLLFRWTGRCLGKPSLFVSTVRAGKISQTQKLLQKCWTSPAALLLIQQWTGLSIAFKILRNANVLTLNKQGDWENRLFPLKSSFLYVPRWTNAVMFRWKIGKFSTFLSEATLSSFRVEFATVLSGKDQVVLHWSVCYTQQTAQTRGKRRQRKEEEEKTKWGYTFGKAVKWGNFTLVFSLPPKRAC